MTIASTVLFGPIPVPNSPTDVYTSPANTLTYVNRIAVANITAGGVELTIWVVRAGDTNIDGNIVVGASAGGQVIPAGPTDPYVPAAMASLVLNPGDAIWMLAGAAASLNTVGSGWTQQ